MEALARKVLKKPLEITVGGRSVVCSDVEQIVEVREDSTKFMRLLEILGQFYNDEDDDARVLIFVDRQEAADNLLRDLIRKGYVCQSLHGGKVRRKLRCEKQMTHLYVMVMVRTKWIVIVLLPISSLALPIS